MAAVLLIHGIANAFGGRSQLLADWEPALKDGVDLAGGELAAHAVESVFYGDVFRPTGRFLNVTDDGGLSPDDLDDDDASLLVAWWHAAAASDPQVGPPEMRALGPRDMVRAALLALSGSRFLVGITEPLLLSWLKQVGDYFRDPGVRGAAQSRLAAAVRADTRVIVAHSLGSVVAYEGLCAHATWPVRHLVTLGSPLGVPGAVFDRLVPAPVTATDGGESLPQGIWPAGLDQWVNISDAADFVALQPRLGMLFGDRVIDVRIDNGFRAHEVQRYLSAAETGAAVLAGLR